MILEIRSHPNGNPSSYIIRKLNGRKTIQHGSHIRQDIAVHEKCEPTKISFDDKPSKREIPCLVITRRRAKELSERARPAKSALKRTESSSEEECETESSSL